MSVEEVILANRLVRGRVDFDSFGAWYGCLDTQGQLDLTRSLLAHACQAGVIEETCDHFRGEAVRAARLDAWLALVESA